MQQSTKTTFNKAYLLLINPVETLVLDKTIDSNTLRSVDGSSRVGVAAQCMPRGRMGTYSESSKEFLCSSVRHGLTFLALMVFESLHGLTRVNCLIGNTWGRWYLERSSSSNGFMSQGSMVSSLNLVISVF